MTNSLIAKNYILTQALEDKSLTHEEVSQIMSSVFDSTVPTDQVSVNFYTRLKNTFISYDEKAQIDPSYKIQYENKSDEEKMRYLLSNFPGSLEHYTILLSKNGIGEPDLAEKLPTVSLNYFAAETSEQGTTVYILDVNLDDKNYVFEIDSSLPFNYYQQPTFEQDFVNYSVFGDALTLLEYLYKTNDLGNEQANNDMVSFLNYLSPFPAQNSMTPKDMFKMLLDLEPIRKPQFRVV